MGCWRGAGDGGVGGAGRGGAGPSLAGTRYKWLHAELRNAEQGITALTFSTDSPLPGPLHLRGSAPLRKDVSAVGLGFSLPA